MKLLNIIVIVALLSSCGNNQSIDDVSGLLNVKAYEFQVQKVGQSIGLEWCDGNGSVIESSGFMGGETGKFRFVMSNEIKSGFIKFTINNDNFKSWGSIKDPEGSYSVSMVPTSFNIKDGKILILKRGLKTVKFDDKIFEGEVGLFITFKDNLN